MNILDHKEAIGKVTMALAEAGRSAREAINSFVQLNNIFSIAVVNFIDKERLEMELKLKLLESRLALLESRQTECEGIRKKLRRKIRNLKAEIAV